jgi:hypothetical protein
LRVHLVPSYLPHAPCNPLYKGNGITWHGFKIAQTFTA